MTRAIITKDIPGFQDRPRVSPFDGGTLPDGGTLQWINLRRACLSLQWVHCKYTGGKNPMSTKTINGSMQIDTKGGQFLFSPTPNPSTVK